MSDRRSRFERLERPRGAGPGGEEHAGTAGRIEGVEAPPGPAPGPAAPAGAGDRFRPPPLRAPDLAGHPAGEQPFLRCARCETDASRYATACPTCGADLHTPEQREWNARLWEARQREGRELEEANASRRAAHEEAQAAAAAARRLAAEEMARQVAHQERERLVREGVVDDLSPGGAWRGDAGARPPGLRWLDRIADPRRRRLAAAGLGGAALLLLALSGGSVLALSVILALAVGLFVPRRGGPRWW